MNCFHFSVSLGYKTTNSLIIYTSIVNPYFEIFEGSFEFNNGTPVMDSDNLIKLNNAEKTEAQIIRRYDLL